MTPHEDKDDEYDDGDGDDDDDDHDDCKCGATSGLGRTCLNIVKKHGKNMEKHGKNMEKHGNTWENHGKTMVNPNKTMVKTWQKPPMSSTKVKPRPSAGSPRWLHGPSGRRWRRTWQRGPFR